jgi:MoaA/NifB/PqqE/SkfB family radical SAM enzyme
VRHLRGRGVKIGLRYTMTSLNAHDLPALLELMREEQVDKFYFSHLNYAGRGNIHRGKDAHFTATRAAMDLLFQRAWEAACEGRPEDYVSGNNDADGPYLLQWASARLPRWHDALRQRLVDWGGNASGLHVANIDNLGEVHPDTMWWHHALGNVRRRPFSAIWADTSDPLMAGLKRQPRPVTGRCGSCAHLAICGDRPAKGAGACLSSGHAWRSCCSPSAWCGWAPTSPALKTCPPRRMPHGCTASIAPPAMAPSAPAAWVPPCCPRAWSACALPRRAA